MKSQTQNKRGYQKGSVWKVGRSFFGRWYRNTLVHCNDLTDNEREKFQRKGIPLPEDGSRVMVRRLHCEKLTEVSDRFRSKRDVQPLLDAKLLQSNEGHDQPESTLSVSDYVQNFFLPEYAEKKLEKSTACGYKNLFKLYLQPRLTKISVRDFRCMHATQLFEDIHRDHGLSRKSLRHCKSLLGSVFTFAKRSGLRDGQNPVEDSGIPHAAAASKGTHAYTASEIVLMLDALTGIARTAIALLYFCGLRPGEARAARWENYTGKTLHIGASMWRTHLKTTKTPESVGEQPVPETLRDILESSRRDLGFILAGPSTKSTRCAKCQNKRKEHDTSDHVFDAPPVCLANLASRTIRPALARCAECHQEKTKHDSADHEFAALPEWRGFYACRRGLSTLATSIDSQLAAKSLLRHANIQTTQQFYIKSVDKDAVRAVAKIDALFQQSANEITN